MVFDIGQFSLRVTRFFEGSPPLGFRAQTRLKVKKKIPIHLSTFSRPCELNGKNNVNFVSVLRIVSRLDSFCNVF